MTTIRSRFKLRRRMLEANQERNYSEEAGLQGEEIARKNLELKLVIIFIKNGDQMKGYYRFPTINKNQIVFVSEDNLWTVNTDLSLIHI